MASKIIEHPLRTIELSYNELKPFHPFEEEMLDRYTHLHNFVKDLCEDYANVQNQFEVHDAHIRKVIARFKAIKTRMGYIGDNAKQAINSMLPDKAHAQRIIEEAHEFKMLLNGFHKDVERLSNESNTMHNVFEPLDTKDEMLSEIFKEYQEFREAMYARNEEYSLDVTEYTKDEKGFISSLADMNDRQAEFINVCNTVIERYNLLIEEVEKTYAQWEQYNEMIEMMRLAIRVPYDPAKICLN